MSSTATPAAPGILATAEADLAKAWSATEHAAIWLAGACLLVKKDVATLAADSPLVADAIKGGEALAIAHGVPLAAIDTAGEAVLAVARQITAAAAPAA